MNFEDLVKMYEAKKAQYGDSTFRHVSELLREAKEVHRRDWLERPTAARDHEQSWRSFKGKNLEKLILHIIRDQVEAMGLSVASGGTLEMTRGANLGVELGRVKRNLSIDYGEFGLHLPDVDIVIYHPRTLRVLATISTKVTLRERIAQTGYWKIKLSQDPCTEHVKVFFVTPDEDRDFRSRDRIKKSRAIVQVDTNGTYVMTDQDFEESGKVKDFERFFSDLRRLADDKGP